MRHYLPAAIAFAALTPLAAAAAQAASPGEVEELRQQVAALQATLDAVSQRLKAIEAAAKPSAQAATPEVRTFTANDYAATSDLIRKAQKAQAIVAGLEKTSRDVFPKTDAAVAEALKRMDADRTAGKALDTRSLRAAEEAQSEALKVYELIPGARRMANLVVGSALDLGDCEVGKPCAMPASGNIDVASAKVQELQRREAQSKATAILARRAAYRFDERLAGVEERNIDEVIEFLAFLDGNKDAQSLFGGDAVRFSAGVKGTTATLRLFALHRISSWFTKDHTLSITTTANKDGPTRFYSDSDGLASTTKLTYGYTFTRAKSQSASAFGRLTQWGLNLTAGHDKFDYTDGKDGPERSTTRTSASVGTTFLVYGSAKKDVHTLAANYDLAYKLPDPAISVPTAQHAWRLGYEYRYIGDSYGFAPAAQYQHKDRTLEVALPFYLFRDQSDDKTPFTGGVSLNHKRTVGHVDKPLRDTSVNVFVGAALSLLD
jgi:hypothetical protein